MRGGCGLIPFLVMTPRGVWVLAGAKWAVRRVGRGGGHNASISVPHLAFDGIWRAASQTRRSLPEAPGGAAASTAEFSLILMQVWQDVAASLRHGGGVPSRVAWDFVRERPVLAEAALGELRTGKSKQNTNDNTGGLGARRAHRAVFTIHRVHTEVVFIPRGRGPLHISTAGAQVPPLFSSPNG